MDAAELPPDALCERCLGQIVVGERAVRFGHISGSTLTGDVEWVYSYLHRYDPEKGCERAKVG